MKRKKNAGAWSSTGSSWKQVEIWSHWSNAYIWTDRWYEKQIICFCHEIPSLKIFPHTSILSHSQISKNVKSLTFKYTKHDFMLSNL